jgi:protein O-mannosyl-transferase
MKRKQQNVDRKHPKHVNSTVPSLPGFWPVILVSVLAVLIYSNAVGHDFVFDDIQAIIENPKITGVHDWMGILRLLFEPWRPLLQFYDAIMYRFFGANPVPFHLVNILIHAVNAGLVYGIAWIAATLWLPLKSRAHFALIAGTVHALHPMYTEAVAYVWGGASAMCATFYLASVLFVMLGYRAGSDIRRYIYCGSALVCGALAWGIKPEALALPFVLAGFFVLVGRWKVAAGMFSIPLILLAARWSGFVGLFKYLSENKDLGSLGFSPSPEIWSYTGTALKGIAFYYFPRFVLPLNLNADPFMSTVTTFWDPYLWVSLLSITALFLVAVWVFKKGHLCLAWALCALLMSPLTAYVFVPLKDVVFEHRAYIPGLAVDLLAGLLVLRIPRYRIAALSVLALVLGFATYRRNEVWANNLTLWTDTVQKSPELERPHLNLGIAHMSTGQVDRALEEYRYVLSLNPKSTAAYVNIATIEFSKGDFEGAERTLQKVVQLSPSLWASYINLSALALRKNELDRALQYADKAYELDRSCLVRLERGDVLVRMGQYAKAMGEFRAALEVCSSSESPRENITARIERLKAAGITE